MDYKLQKTASKDAFNYKYLLGKIFPYIKPVLPRAIINLAIAIPLGLLDGVVALSLKPYLDYVINGDPQHTWTFLGLTVHSQAFLATIIPFGIVAFALFQGVLKYVSNYLTDWTGQKISMSLKKDLFKKLTSMDPQFFDVNSSGIVLTRFLSYSIKKHHRNAKILYCNLLWTHWIGWRFVVQLLETCYHRRNNHGYCDYTCHID